RLVRTRGAAAALAGSGYVRVNGARINAPGRMIRAGDVITVALDRGVRVLKVIGFVDRRGAAPRAAALFPELGWSPAGLTTAKRRSLRGLDPCDRSKASKKRRRVRK